MQAILIKVLTLGQTVILDNISFHKIVVVKSLIESLECELLYLPTHSPDLNLIEHYWFKVKNDIRKVSHLFNDFFDEVFFILQCVTSFHDKLYSLIKLNEIFLRLLQSLNKMLHYVEHQ
ncbi:IS630 family transposase [Orientia tsutsugamushi]|uniref:IS630 family transposase n=2 Tax=Orientia tsutsugamushi TaxID=784 RepID=A0A2U3RT27_ORITS|nr:DDE superendonuclease family protein [Orientia tsutsugamushi str. Karp]SPR16375.1 IS630 family transposase [Orientia tsutsugamushi]